MNWNHAKLTNINCILNQYCQFLIKTLVFFYFGHISGVFQSLFNSTSFNNSLTSVLNYLLNHHQYVWIEQVFELNWIGYWMESIVAEIHTLNWILSGIAQGYTRWRWYPCCFCCCFYINWRMFKVFRFLSFLCLLQCFYLLDK